ncbi:hypothetical protein [Flavobacterium sp. NKUCC04_CG]|uniref:hypothetical protein n=1 Tax=Flavobacterium sp. NKUCC04_CG TaxID=2842121 RepID=UPI001C5BB9E4|nr:hypothetical protein [Flavobacterium sp. NKUCC04_CG]MBW3518082.1 hypothetical protein [Flavobacterium sp. NKUCC04_CG]
MAIIKIERKNDLSNRFRDYNIYIDGNKVGTIANGEVKEFTVDSSGTHSVKATIDWCSSQELFLNLNSADTIPLKLNSITTKWGIYYFLLTLFVAGINFVYKNEFISQLMMVIVLPGLLIMIYFFTFARKKYLKLTQIDTVISEQRH